jgi:murein DD-endopeptidase MepM/ murein hydrolase activator NlpD
MNVLRRSSGHARAPRFRDWRSDLRTFGAGAGCGVLGGIVLTVLMLRQFGAIGWPGSMPAQASHGETASGVLEPASPTATSGRGSAPGSVEVPVMTAPRATPAELKARDLLIPVDGIKPEQLTRQFDDRRGGNRPHEAIDILAPRFSPVRAVEDGTIARLFLSKAGGITVYQFDPTGTFCYYYAHLERYADGLAEGDKVRKGAILGFVGTSGNAPKDTPHLHFAIFKLTEAKQWWEGTPIDPYDVLR